MARLPVVSAAAAQLFTTRGAIRRHFEREVLAAPERVDAAKLEHCYRSARQRDAQRALVAYLAGDLALDVTALLPQLSVPVWLGWGRQALSPPVETADLWIRLLSGANPRRKVRLEVFEGSGLLPHLEEPVELARRLHSFLVRP